MPIAEYVLSVLAPHECLVCGREGALICTGCAYDTFEPVPERCYRCLSRSKDSAVCQKCRRNTVLKYVWVTAEYEGVNKELMRLFKFERAQAAHKIIAEQMAETLPYFKPETIITYVPTATSRHRLRGYDQSELIAKRVAKLKGMRYLSLLERFGQTRQVGATKKQRFEQATQMFRLKRSMPEGSEVIILDDILTTGASLEAAARLLKDAGAKQVSAAVFAQKH